MHIAICDDQTEYLDSLVQLLELWQQENHTTLRYKCFQSGAELVDAAEKEAFSLYFLDVMMPGVNGLAAARDIRSLDDTADIVFLTSSRDFAYESYSVHALDYLLKPVSRKLLFPILDRLHLKEQKPQDGLTIKCGSTLIRIPFSQLVYVEVLHKRLYFNLTDGTVHEVGGSLKDYDSLLLSQPEFMQTHRSYIVNMLQAAELSQSEVRTFSGKSVPVSRLLYPQLQQDNMKLMFSQREG